MPLRPQRPLALVTGATRGIGLAIARALAPDHRLFLTGRSESALAEIAAELGSVTDVLTSPTDLSDGTALANLAQQAKNSGVDVLVNNAGVAPSFPLGKTDDATWDDTLAVNLTAPFVLCRALAPRMAEQGWGRIVNIVSTAGLKGYRFTTAYSASKGGLLALGRALSAELCARGVTVNAVCPGFTDTDIVAAAVANIATKTGRDTSQARAALERFSPIGRLVDPVEVAGCVAYLVSDAAAAITGAALPIDGGETST